MGKEKSPKKRKPLKSKHAADNHRSIEDLFNKQRQKVLEKQWSDQNWRESIRNAELLNDADINASNDKPSRALAENGSVFNTEAPSTSGYFANDKQTNVSTADEHKKKLSRLSLGRKSKETGTPCSMLESERLGVDVGDARDTISVALKRKRGAWRDENVGDVSDSVKCTKQDRENDSQRDSVLCDTGPETVSEVEAPATSKEGVNHDGMDLTNAPSESHQSGAAKQALGTEVKSEQCDDVSNPVSIDESSEKAVTTVDDTLNGESESQENETEEFRVPYYLENFQFILNAVINDEFYAYLFDESDREIISNFQNLSENAQKLYVRLFGRIHRWLRKSKIVYPKIADDLSEVLDELASSRLVMSESEMTNLEEVLKSLPAPEVKIVGKSLKLNTSQTRDDVIAAILKHTSQCNIGSFFSVGRSTAGGDSALKKSVLQRSRKLLGSCYKLRKEERVVFMRMLMLFGLHNTRLEDSERDTGQQQIFQMLMSNIGRVKYPEYKILRTTKIFQNRDSLIRFTSALQVETDISEALEKKEFDAALEIYNDAVTVANELHNNYDLLKHDKSLPPFLRCYTAGAVYVRVLTYGVELLQFTKKYAQAVEQLEVLIRQDVYHLDYRGRWCERLALDLDFHLKKPSHALDIIQQSLNDDNIRKGHRYALFQRAQKICNTGSNKLKRRWEEFEADPMNCVQQAPEVFIEARKQEVPGGYPLFITEDSYTAQNQNVTFMKRVEDVALNYYAKEGYPQGIHGEGGTFSFLFGLFLWNVIFIDGIPDAFYNLYQTHPLDLYCRHFYTSREEDINKRLGEIRKASIEELEEMLTESWQAHQDVFCIGVNWERFDDVVHACGLLKCIGGFVLAAIFERFATDMRFTRSGLPDLTVWNPDTGKFKVVEVKGPGDRLSTKQILWLDYLLAIGVDAEVCYVKAIGAKKLQPVKQQR